MTMVTSQKGLTRKVKQLFEYYRRLRLKVLACTADGAEKRAMQEIDYHFHRLNIEHQFALANWIGETSQSDKELYTSLGLSEEQFYRQRQRAIQAFVQLLNEVEHE